MHPTRFLRFAIGGILFITLTSCGSPTQPIVSTLTTVTISVSSASSGLGMLAVPTDVSSASLTILRVASDGTRSPVTDLDLDLSAPSTTVELLRGETYDFILSLLAANGTEIGYALVQDTVVPNLTVTLLPRGVIAAVRTSSVTYDGKYLLVQVEVITPGGGSVAHLDYELDVSVVGGTVSAQGPLGVEIIPDNASEAVVLDVIASGLLETRAIGQIAERFEIIPSALEPGHADVVVDLTPPTIGFDVIPSTIPVGGPNATIWWTASDNVGVDMVRVYVNMVLRATSDYTSNPPSASGSFGDLYSMEARNMRVDLVAIDVSGNIAMATAYVRAE